MYEITDFEGFLEEFYSKLRHGFVFFVLLLMIELNLFIIIKPEVEIKSKTTFLLHYQDF